MNAQKEVLLSLLKLTRTGPVHRKLLSRDARVSAIATEQALRKLFRSDLVWETENLIDASQVQRVKIAVYALKLGADSERVCSLLSWNEFESVATQVFEINGYRTMKNFRFKHASKRWEIDVVATKKPLILCVDCKHWKRGWQRAATVKAVETQTERTQAFAKTLPNYNKKAKLENWETATVIPMVMSLKPGPYKFHNNVPVVPVLQLQDFINELPAQARLLKTFHQKCVNRDKDLRTFCQ